jgi:hypothetical protein
VYRHFPQSPLVLKRHQQTGEPNKFLGNGNAVHGLDSLENSTRQLDSQSVSRLENVVAMNVSLKRSAFSDAANQSVQRLLFIIAQPKFFLQLLINLNRQVPGLVVNMLLQLSQFLFRQSKVE